MPRPSCKFSESLSPPIFSSSSPAPLLYIDRFSESDSKLHKSTPSAGRYDRHPPLPDISPEASGRLCSFTPVSTLDNLVPMTHPRPPSAPHGDYREPVLTIVYTSDSKKKLTNVIHRRCFNCCTTDTSTWRRSNLCRGKILCNGCGLFERVHSRQRPEQFPYKRGVAKSLSCSTTRDQNETRR